MRTLLILIGLSVASAATAAPPVERLHAPPGFKVTLFSGEVPSARQIALGANGTVFVGSMKAGKVYALTDADGDGRAERVRVVAKGLKMPVGVAFHDGDLYVSAVSRIVVLRDIERHLDDPPKPELVTDKLPAETHHGWKFIAFGPDGRLYVPVGAPCNICDPDARYAKLMSMRPDGGDWRDVARGIRNTVGFDWQPGSGKLWFTDNGRDMLGDDLPGDELNRIDRAGQHFGYPYCHQGDTLDPEFGKGHDCKDHAPPALKLGAHVAALGMRFYTGRAFPARYRHAIFLAEHGSWNRSRKSGYRVVAVFVDGDEVAGSETFLGGFLDGERTLGRPVDVQPLPDGSLLVSDDYAGAVYRVEAGIGDS